MSRIGRLPIAIPAGVTVEDCREQCSDCKRSKGTLEKALPTEMEINS